MAERILITVWMISFQVSLFFIIVKDPLCPNGQRGSSIPLQRYRFIFAYFVKFYWNVLVCQGLLCFFAWREKIYGHAMRLEGCKRKLLLAMRYERFNGTQVAQIRQISADSWSVFLASLQKAKILQNQCV